MPHPTLIFFYYAMHTLDFAFDQANCSRLVTSAYIYVDFKKYISNFILEGVVQNDIPNTYTYVLKTP